MLYPVHSPQHNLPKPQAEFVFRYAGKLLLEQEFAPDLASYKHCFSKIPTISRKFGYLQCVRCGNQKPSLFGKIPCEKCHTTHFYCRNCIQMGRVMQCESLYVWSGEVPVWQSHESPLSWDRTLTDAQLHASNRIVQAIQQQEKELAVWAVCGSGKTEMLFRGIEAALKLGKRVCIATPRADVVRELQPRFKEAFQTVPVQALYGGSDEKEGSAQLIIATTHQLLRFHKTFDVVIIDEVDAFPFHNDATLPYAVNRAKKDRHTMIYVTATPRQDLRLKMTLRKLPYVFVPVRYHGHPLPVPRLHMSISLKKAIKERQLPISVLTWIKKRKNPNRQLLIFVPTIALAEELAEKLREGSTLPFQSIVSAHSEDEQRVEKIIQFRNREIQLLITTTILERGVTFPSVDVIVLDAGHMVFDDAALVQIAGRAGRSMDDPTGEVLFVHNGKTNAMVKSIRSIQSMNKRGGFSK